MRIVIAAALAAVLLGSAPVRAADSNYNTQSVSTTNSTTANCQASFMLSGCGAVAAPLPALGAGALGAALMSCAAGLGLVLRRRRERHAG